MPALWLASLAGLLMELARSLFGKIILSLGVASVSYTGISLVVDQLSVLAFSQLSGIGGVAGAFVQMLHMQSALSMILSAVVVKFTLLGVGPNGAISRLHFKVPSKQGGLF